MNENNLNVPQVAEVNQQSDTSPVVFIDAGNIMNNAMMYGFYGGLAGAACTAALLCLGVTIYQVVHTKD